MVMGGKGLRSCEMLDTIDNSAEYEAARKEAKKRVEAAKMALVAEKEAGLLVNEALDEMPKLKDAESRAKVTWQRAVDTNAPDQQEMSDKAGIAREARINGQERLNQAKTEYQIRVDKRQTADLVAQTFAADAEALKKIWTPLASLGVSRFEAAYCKTPDGRILAFGGENSHCQMQDTCEMYQPATDTWRPLPEGQLLMPLTDHRACLIRCGFQGGFHIVADVDQAAHARERPPEQQFEFTKAQRLVAKHQVELTEDEKARDKKPWTKKEEERLRQLVKLHPFGSEAEWRAIATDLGTLRSWHACQTHFQWMELGAGKKLRGGLDGHGRVKTPKGKGGKGGKGKGKGKAGQRGKGKAAKKGKGTK